MLNRPDYNVCVVTVECCNWPTVLWGIDSSSGQNCQIYQRSVFLADRSACLIYWNIWLSERDELKMQGSRVWFSLLVMCGALFTYGETFYCTFPLSSNNGYLVDGNMLNHDRHKLLKKNIEFSPDMRLNKSEFQTHIVNVLDIIREYEYTWGYM